jgi:undecaprenyl diphosphate synthase
MKSSIYIFEKGIKYLSVFAFSTENFKRDVEEVSYIMNLFILFFKTRMKEIEKRGIKVVFSGSKNNLSSEVISAMDKIIDKTKDNTNGTLNICLNYGSQDEIVDMTKKISLMVLNNEITIEEIDKDLISKNMYVDLPPLDFVIRTSGENRISNFMMYQSSYAEYYFTPTLFPDFDEKEVDNALDEYKNRNRSFGQVKTTTT